MKRRPAPEFRDRFCYAAPDSGGGAGGSWGGGSCPAQGDQKGNREGSSKEDDPQGAEEVLTNEHPGTAAP